MQRLDVGPAPAMIAATVRRAIRPVLGAVHPGRPGCEHSRDPAQPERPSSAGPRAVSHRLLPRPGIRAPLYAGKGAYHADRTWTHDDDEYGRHDAEHQRKQNLDGDLLRLLLGALLPDESHLLRLFTQHLTDG